MTQARTLEKYLGKAGEIADRTGADPHLVEKILKDVKKDIERNRRQPAPEPPKGSICLSEAARKYDLHQKTISRWANGGKIPILLRTDHAVYVDEVILDKVVAIYLKKPGRGRRTVQKKFSRQIGY